MALISIKLPVKRNAFILLNIYRHSYLVIIIWSPRDFSLFLPPLSLARHEQSSHSSRNLIISNSISVDLRSLNDQCRSCRSCGRVDLTEPMRLRYPVPRLRNSGVGRFDSLRVFTISAILTVLCIMMTHFMQPQWSRFFSWFFPGEWELCGGLGLSRLSIRLCT